MLVVGEIFPEFTAKSKSQGLSGQAICGSVGCLQEAPQYTSLRAGKEGALLLVLWLLWCWVLAWLGPWCVGRC